VPVQQGDDVPPGVPGKGTSSGRLPNLFVIGVSKAGTTSLFNYLGQHPDVCPSDLKETYYFAPLRHGGELGPLEEYARHFLACTGQRYAVEATPGYFYGGVPLARGLREVCTGARALLSLRSPTERCWSWFQFQKSRLRLPRDMSFDAYLDRCEDLHRAGVDGEVEHRPFWGLGGGCYATWFDAWQEVFGRDFRVVFFEDLVRDPAGVVRDVCRWLRVDDSVVDGFEFSVENRTQLYRAASLQRVAVLVNRRGERFFHRYPALKRSIRSGYQLLNRQAAQERMTSGTRARLADFYRPHDARLAAQLTAAGIPLPAWLDNAATSPATDPGPLPGGPGSG
jgi:hypothetical protein